MWTGTSSSAPIPIPLGTAPTSPTITPSLRPPTHITSSIPDKSKQSLSTRLQTEEKREIQDLLKRYVPHEVIRRSPIWKKFPFHSQNLSSRSTESLNGSSAFKDGPTSSPSSKCLSTSMSRSRKATEMHRYSFPCLPPRVHRRATCPLPEELDRENDLEWVVLDTSSVTDSGTCSGSSLDSSLDIEIGNLSKQTHGMSMHVSLHFNGIVPSTQQSRHKNLTCIYLSHLWPLLCLTNSLLAPLVTQTSKSKRLHQMGRREDTLCGV